MDTQAHPRGNVDPPGYYNVWGMVIVIYLVGSAIAGLSMMGAPPSITQVIQGAILSLAIVLARLSSKRAAKAS